MDNKKLVLNARVAALINMNSDKILFEKQADEKLYMANMTNFKILCLLDANKEKQKMLLFICVLYYKTLRAVM